LKLNKSKQIALCGLLGAMMVVTMLLGSIFPLTSILCPALAGLFLIPANRECGFGFALMLYICVSVLSLLLVPDKEAALLFSLLLGPYPLLRPYFNRISIKPLNIAVKLLFCNLLVAVVYVLLLFVVAPAAFSEEYSSTAMLLLLLVMTNLSFFVYDIFLHRISFLYEYKFRDKLFHGERH
jgi:hypothetical protein